MYARPQPNPGAAPTSGHQRRTVSHGACADRPADCSGYVRRLFLLGTYKHAANGSFRRYAPARRQQIAEEAARLAARIVAPHTAQDGGEASAQATPSTGAEEEVEERTCQTSCRPKDEAAARSRLLARLHRTRRQR